MTSSAILLNLTSKGVENPSNAQELVKSVLKTFEDGGGSLKAFVWGEGDFDMIAIVDAAPETVSTLETALARGGIVAVQSVSGVSDDEFVARVQARAGEANGDSAKTHAEGQAKTHAEGQAKTHAEEQAKTHAEGQAKTHAEEQAKTHAEEQAKTHAESSD